MTEILKTQNKTWGFWGTVSNHIEHKKDMQAFWDKAAEIIQSKGLTPQQTLGLMDSRWGRHIADEFAEELLKAEHVALIPGSAFGACGEGHVRCSYATSIDKISEALARIENFLKNHKR